MVSRSTPSKPYCRSTPNIKAACEECRSRKVKCDGARPICHRCTKKDKQCFYDAEPDEYRSATLKRKCKEYQHRALLADELLRLLKDSTDEEAVGMLVRLRGNESVSSVIACATGPLPQISWPTSPMSTTSYGAASFGSGAGVDSWPQPNPPNLEMQKQATVPPDPSPAENLVDRYSIDFLVNHNQYPPMAKDERSSPAREDRLPTYAPKQSPTPLQRNDSAQHPWLPTPEPYGVPDGPSSSMANGNGVDAPHPLVDHYVSGDQDLPSGGTQQWKTYHADVTSMLRMLARPRETRP